MTRALLAVIAAYLIGGVPFGLILFKTVGGGDIRRVGSGNIGATNVARSAGWGIGIVTLLLDAAKGSAAVLIGRAATGDPGWGAAAALAVVVGHCFPVYLGFKGGKGVATGAGAFAVMHPAAMGISLVIFLAAVAVTRMVSAGSVLAALGFPVATMLMGAGSAVTLCGAGAAAVIVGRHHENLRRIAGGRERKIGARRAEENR